MRLARAGATALLLAGLTSCPGGGAPGPNPTAQSPHPVRGGVLRVLLADDVDSLDPQRAASPPSFGIVRALHRGLMAFAAAPFPDGARPVPDLAAAQPEVSADGIRYTFTLRGDAAFGAPASRPVRAADVKAGLERVFQTSSPFARSFRVIAGVAAVDDRTVVIRLARPANDFLSILALPAASAVPAGLGPRARAADISPSGPYRLAPGDGYQPERSIRLVRNGAWKEGSDPVRGAWVDEIRFSIGTDRAEIARRVASGAADLAGEAIDPSLIPATIPSVRVVRAPNGCLRYLFMNVRVAPFGSAGVRAAVAMALDRRFLAGAHGPGAQPAATILPPTVDGYDAARPFPEKDLDGARATLARAGRPGGFATQLVAGDLPADRAQARIVRAELAAVGVRAGLSILPVAIAYEDRYQVRAANVPMGIATWCADWPGRGGRSALAPLVDGRTIAARGNTNYSGMHDPALERMLDAAAAEPDGVAAARDWMGADALATRLAAVVPLAHLAETSPLGPRVRGFVPHPFFARGDLTALWLES